MLSLCVPVASPAANGKGLQTPPVQQVVHGRIVAHVPLKSFTTVGLNHESYLVEADTKTNGKVPMPRFIKISYRYYLQDLRIPPAFLDYSLVHTFHATREPGCDQSFEALATRYTLDRNGKVTGQENALDYSKGAPTEHPDPQLVLQCYVVTPRDYKASTAVASRQASGDQTHAE